MALLKTLIYDKQSDINNEDTEKIYERIIENLAKSYNRPYPWDVRMRILGTTERRTCEIAVKELDLPCTVDEFHRQYQLSCLKNLENVFLLKGSWTLDNE